MSTIALGRTAPSAHPAPSSCRAHCDRRRTGDRCVARNDYRNGGSRLDSSRTEAAHRLGDSYTIDVAKASTGQGERS